MRNRLPGMLGCWRQAVPAWGCLGLGAALTGRLRMGQLGEAGGLKYVKFSERRGRERREYAGVLSEQWLSRLLPTVKPSQGRTFACVTSRFEVYVRIL